MLVIEIHGGSALFSGQKIWKSKKSIGQRTFVSEGLVSYNSPKINVVTWVVGIPNVNLEDINVHVLCLDASCIQSKRASYLCYDLASRVCIIVIAAC